MRILLTGDLHLGRTSSGVRGASSGLRAAEAWGRIVDLALRQDVRAVLVSGDLVDHANRFFEATGPLQRGLSRLAARGIQTVAVAGNHDHAILPAVARECAGPEYRFQWLGRGGTWESTVLEASGRPAMRVLGWSFASESHCRDPLESFPSELPRDLPVLGMVHGDLDAPGSRYAPLSRTRLAAQPVAGWLLGHVHAPRRILAPGQPWVLYPGSPQALDPGEPGVHGAWIAEVGSLGVAPPDCVPTSSVRYEQVVVDVGGVKDETDAMVVLRRALRQQADLVLDEGGGELKTLVADLAIEGMTPAAGAVGECLRQLEESGGLDLGLRVEVRQSVNRATPPFDLAALAQGRSLPASLARLVLELESGARSREVEDAMSRGRRAVDGLALSSRCREGDREVGLELGDDALRRSLATAARRLLAGLVAAGRPGEEGGAP